MPLQTVEPTRLYRQIADQIGALIDAGEFPAGARLPAERELASQLGVSRTSVREAIICLELAGRVEVRVGTGIFVTRGRPGRAARVALPAANDDAGPGPFDLLAARRLIEGEIAALAAKSVRKRDLAALRESVARMAGHDEDFAVREAADRAFHVGIAEATGNDALAAVVDAMWGLRRGELWTRLESHFHTRELHARTIEDHQAIVDALAAHDPEAARAAMRRHLARVGREFQRKVDAKGRAQPARAAALDGTGPDVAPAQSRRGGRSAPSAAS